VRAQRQAIRVTRSILPLPKIGQIEFLNDRISRNLVFLRPRLLFVRCRIFPKYLVYSLDQKTINLVWDGRFTALMPAEMSYSNRLRRRFRQISLMPIRHGVVVYGIRRRSLASE
jgi:hypothetical protein